MLLIALKLQLAALASVAGIDTAKITSPDVKSILEKLETIQKDVAANTSKVDINQASSEAVKAVAALAEVILRLLVPKITLQGLGSACYCPCSRMCF
jgi:hypothetical protein